MAQVRVGLAGASGYGLVHLRRLAELTAEGRTRLIGVADPAGPSELTPPDVPFHADLDALLAAEVPDVVIVSTPIHTHVPLSVAALRAGADVYLEKPPAPSLLEFAELAAVSAETQRAVQIGFQALGSHGFARIAELVADGVIGTPLRVEATGEWVRTRSYYARSAWAGRRTMGDRVVADGVVTNPLSHSIAAALRLAGIATLDDIDTVTTELYRAHDIECDDTSFVAVTPAAGDSGGAPTSAGAAAASRLPVVGALTVCGEQQLPPRVDVVGDAGRVSFRYTEDGLDITSADGSVTSEDVARIDLVANLLDHREDPDATPLLSPLVGSGPFTAVLQAIQDAEPPTVISDGISWQGTGGDAHPVIADAGRWLSAAVADGGGFAAVGAPFADGSAVKVHRPR